MTNGIENPVTPTPTRTCVAPAPSLAVSMQIRSSITINSRNPDVFTVEATQEVGTTRAHVGETTELHLLLTAATVITLVFHKGNVEASARRRDRGIIVAKVINRRHLK